MLEKTSEPFGNKALRGNTDQIPDACDESPPLSGFNPDEHRWPHEHPTLQTLLPARDGLAAALAQFTDLYEFSPASYFILDGRGKILRTNLAGSNLLGIERPALSGSDFSLLISRRDKGAWADFFRQILAVQAAMARELSLETKLGCLYVQAEGVGDGSGCRCWLVLVDITARKRAEQELAASEKRYRLLVETTNEGIWSLDINHATSFVNPVMAKMLGYSVEEMLGTRLEEFVFAEDMEQHAQRMQTRHAGIDEVYERRFKRKDGSSLWALISAKVIKDADGRYAGSFGMLTDITGRKQLETTLRESEARYRSVVEDQSELICRYLPDGRLSFANDAYLRYYGLPREEALGNNFVPRIPESDQAAILIQLSSLTPDNPVVNFAHRIILPSGEIRWQQWTHRAIHTPGGELLEYQAVGADVTESKNAELELVKLRRCVEKSSATILITDKNGIIEYVNPAFTEMTGYTREEVIGKNTRVLKSGAHPESFYREMWQVIAAGYTWRGEICNRKKNGELFWEQAAISSVKDKNGVITNYFAVKDDISDQKDLERIKEDVERIMRHDLKTPLNAIMGIPQLLEMDGNLTKEQLEMIKAIENSGKRMLFMINSSLDLFKMETGKYEYAPWPVNALDVIKRLEEHSRPQMSAKNLSLRVTVDGNRPGPDQTFVFESEEQLLYSLFSNLIANAIEASPQDEEIVLGFANTKPKTIAIRNKGVVPKEIRGHFFEKYKTYGKKTGTGLGAYSAKLHAETMGYGIAMSTSDEENTTCITISVPDAK
jgi:PAS domain S-box-containing protein